MPKSLVSSCANGCAASTTTMATRATGRTTSAANGSMQSWDSESESNAGECSDYQADLLDTITIDPDSDDDDRIATMTMIGPFVGQMLDPPPPPGNPLQTPHGLVVLSDAELASQKSKFQAVIRLLGGGVYNTPLYRFGEYVLNFGLLGAIDTPGGLVDCPELEFMFGDHALDGIVYHAYPYYLDNVRKGKGAWVLSSAGVKIYYGWFAAPSGMRQSDASRSIDTPNACPPTWYPSIIILHPDGTIQVLCLKMLYLLCRLWTAHHNRVVIVARL
jgi:hypothetical protein